MALGDLLASPKDLTYGVVQPGQHVEDGVPIIRVKDIRHGRVAAEAPMRIAAGVEAQYERSRLRGGELLVTLVGTVGEVAVAGPGTVGWNVARAVAVARFEPNVPALWVAYNLRRVEAVDRIAARVNTTVQTTLNLKDLRELPVVMPPDPELYRILDILRSLDDKVAINQRIMGLLQDEMRTGLAALQGGEMQEIGAVSSLVRDGVQPDSLPADTAYIGLEHMPQRDLALGNRGSARDVTSTKSRFRQGDVLFGKLRPYFNKVGVAQFDGICSSDILVVRPTDEVWRPWLALTLSSSAVIDHATAVSSGTRMPRAKWTDLAS